MLRESKNGNLSLLNDDLALLVREKTLFSIERIKQILDDDSVKPLLHRTTRKFEGYNEFYYYSLKLKNVSVESLTWIIKSIFRD